MVTEERNLQKIRKHLEDEGAQRRVRQNIQKGRNEVTVTIGRAARLFNFSESQLRDWEKIGLIKPMRPKEGAESKSMAGQSGHSGQRQYSFTELDKLAIIRELLDEANLMPGSIPPNIDKIWHAIDTSTQEDAQDEQDTGESRNRYQHEPIDRRVTIAYRHNLSWRFYASRVLWLSLMLLYEDVPGFSAGLILPSHENTLDADTLEANNLAWCGESLVGWLGQTSSFYTFLTPEPTFEYPSDFRVLPLRPPELRESLLDSPTNRTLIIVQRQQTGHIRQLEKAIRTVQRLLEPLYEDQQSWYQYFGAGVNELVNPGMDYRPKLPDAVLTGLTNMTIRLGGKIADGEDHWSACCVLLPNNDRLPLQQRSLVVRAKSQYARQLLGVTTSTPERYSTSLSLRAYQGGHIIYRPELAYEDTTPLLQETEGPTRSSIAVPIGGETGAPEGVLYVSSYEPGAFDEDDQRVLRIMVRLIEELLNTYSTRQRATKKMLDLLEDPGTVDALFKEFLSENEFLHDIEELLETIQQNREARQAAGDQEEPISEISFIGIDIDTDVQERIANSYGDQTLRNLNKVIGVRIRDLLPALFTNYLSCKLYHIYAGRYYLFLRDFSLEKTKSNAERLRIALKGSIAVKQSDVPGGTLMLPDISVHLGVTHYSYDKLLDFLIASQMRSNAEISSTLYHSLDFVLKLGIDTGGDTVYAWNPIARTFAPYQPEEEKE